MPLVNQTSQFFANVYLDLFDRFVWHGLAEKTYIRYVDDFMIFGHDKRRLARCASSAATSWPTWDCGCTRTNRSFCGRATACPSWAIASFPRIACWRGRRDADAATPARACPALAHGQVSREDVQKRWAGWWGHARHARSLALRVRFADGFHKQYEAALATLSPTKGEQRPCTGR